MRKVGRHRLWQGLFVVFVMLCLPVIASATNWSWRDDGQYGIWSWGTTDRFRYDYSASQWWDYTIFGDWQRLGAVGASPVTREQGLDLEHFIGNGTWRDLLTGWYYSYDSTCAGGVGVSLWRDNTDPFRFSYCYATGQWNDFSWYSSGYWTGLGTQGRSQVFIGDGGWYNLGNSWEYQYATSTNMGCGLWRDNTDPLRFSYCYNTGQWNDFSFYTPGYWSGIGQGTMSSAFIGNGDWHDLENGWAYSYTTVSNMGVSLWRDNTAPMRFSYCYNTGQWNDFSFYTPGYWSGLGLGNMSSAFIGDGGWYDLGTGWSFRYRSWLNGYAVWKDADGMQFSYGYLYGMWNDYSIATDTWAGLGSGSLTSAFIGDGQPHDVGLIGGLDWSYTYASGYGTWHDIAGGADRFKYDYIFGQWQDNRAGEWHLLGAECLASSFVGDTDPHSLGDGFTYTWLSLDKVGRWYLDATHSFQYGYSTMSPGWSYSLDGGTTWLPWAQTTLAADTWTGQGGNPSWIMAAADGLLYFIAENDAGLDLYQWNGSLLTNVSHTGFDSLSYNVTTYGGDWLYFVGRDWEGAANVYLYNLEDPDWTMISEGYGPYSAIEYATYLDNTVYFSATDTGSGNEYLYRAVGDVWSSVSDQGFYGLGYAATIGSDLFYYGNPVGGNSYVYRLHDGLLDQIGHTDTLYYLLYSGKNSTDLFFWGSLDSGGFDIFRCWDDPVAGWSFADISNMAFTSYSAYSAQTVNNDVYFLPYDGATGNYPLYRWNAASELLAPVPDASFRRIKWTSAPVIDGALYFQAGTGASGYDVYRCIAGSITQISSLAFNNVSYVGNIGSTLYWIGRYLATGNYEYDLYSSTGTSFETVTTDNFSDLRFQTQVGNDIYFAGHLGDSLYDLYGYNSSGWKWLTDTPYVSVTYEANLGTEGLIWRGTPDWGVTYYYMSYDPATGAYGQWSSAQLGSSNLEPYNRDYYFSGKLDGGDGLELMRYWGDYTYLTARPVK